MDKAGNAKKAILLLGHGSKRAEANDTLREVAASLRVAGGYGYVLAAFLQIERPDLQEGIDVMASKGFDEITVMPYFLYPGLHVTKDLPEELAQSMKKHPGLKVKMAKNIGFHKKLIDITIERIDETDKETGEAPVESSAFVQHPIEKESFRILSGEIDETRFSPFELPVIKRVIHSTADFEFQSLIGFSRGPVEAGIKAVMAGRNIITDVRMIEAGITKERLAPFGVKVLCFSSDEDVARAAKADNTTKTAASMRKAAGFMEGGIVAIGNAPTALMELLRIVREGAAKPALVIGVPVGFVGAAESKEELMRSEVEYITSRGRKGGSTVAVAIVNAIAIEAGKMSLKQAVCERA